MTDRTELRNALARLRERADATTAAWEMKWVKVKGPGPDEYELKEYGFPGMVLEPGRDLVLKTELKPPELFAGVPLAGQRLEMTVNSLYPVEIEYAGRPLLDDDIPPVALGPALITVVDPVQPGQGEVLQLKVKPPNNQVPPWLWIRFSSPAIRQRFEALDIAWAKLLLANALSSDEPDLIALEEAVSSVPDPVPEDEESVLNMIRQIDSSLSRFEDRAAGLRVHLIGHSHIDMNWLWTWQDTVQVIKRDFKAVLDLMDDYPEMRFTHSQPATYEVIRLEEPELFKRVLDHVQSGRWEAATMTWVEGDTNMASGEAMARQLLEGVRFSREELGAEPSIFMAPDTFGHAGNLPQLAVSAGAVAYYHHRCNPADPERWPAYTWEGQDGTRILAISTGSYNGEITAGALSLAAVHALSNGHSSSLHFYGVGDHGGGPTRLSLETMRRLAVVKGLPSAQPSSLREYADQIAASGTALPVHRGESPTIFEGCYTTHADTKRANRVGENSLVTADTLAAITGVDRKDELRREWRKVCFHQFHDILDGSAIHEAYEHTMKELDEIAATANEVVNASISVLDRAAEGQIKVANPLGWDRTDLVFVPGTHRDGAVWLVDEDGVRTPGQYVDGGLIFVAQVPSFGVRGYVVETAGDPADTLLAVPRPTRASPIEFLGHVNPEGGYFGIETESFQVFVRRNSGIITGFVDKRAGRELVAYGMRRASDYADTARVDLALGVLQLMEERPHGMTAWHLDEVFRETSLIDGATTEVVESGPVRLVLKTSHHLQESKITQSTIFYRDLARVDFTTRLAWNEVGGPERGIPNLKVAFTPSLWDCQAWFETPFGAIRRPANGQEVPALRWAEVGGEDYGAALVNDSKYGYDVLGNRIRLSLVRSAYDPDAVSDAGNHEIRYSFVPHQGGWREAGVVKRAREFNQPLIAWPATPNGKKEGSRLFSPKVDSDSVIVECLKMAHEGSGRIIRLYESAGRDSRAVLRAIPPNSTVWEATVVEDRVQKVPVERGSVSLDFGPWQVRTLLIEDF